MAYYLEETASEKTNNSEETFDSKGCFREKDCKRIISLDVGDVSVMIASYEGGVKVAFKIMTAPNGERWLAANSLDLTRNQLKKLLAVIPSYYCAFSEAVEQRSAAKDQSAQPLILPGTSASEDDVTANNEPGVLLTEIVPDRRNSGFRVIFRVILTGDKPSLALLRQIKPSLVPTRRGGGGWDASKLKPGQQLTDWIDTLSGVTCETDRDGQNFCIAIMEVTPTCNMMRPICIQVTTIKYFRFCISSL